MKHSPIRFQREREYPIPVGEAWRLLADTDHVNRTIGLPPIAFSPLDDGAAVRRASARAFGVVPLRWREYPFEWIRERRYVVRREFENGPVAVLEGSVELEPTPGGVRVVVASEFTPRNLAGRVLWRLGTSTVNDMVEFCDRSLARRAAGKADPVPVPRRAPRVDRARLDYLLDRLRNAPVRPELVDALRERTVEGSDDQLLRLRAATVAADWGADRDDVLRLFLHATRVGLFELRWELMCPTCRVPKAETPSLARLPDRFHCETCGIDYDTELDRRVELRFSISPSIRSAENVIHCIGGPLRTPHVIAQVYLLPREGRDLSIRLDTPLRVRAVGGAHRLVLRPHPALRNPAEVPLIYADGVWVGPHSLAEGDGDVLRVPSGATLRLRNQTSGPLLTVVEEEDWSSEATTADHVTASQEFRDLFSAEVLAPGQQLAVQDLAILFSDLRGSTSMYELVGDAPAYGRVNRHFGFMGEHIAAHGGVTVKTIGDGIMGAFVRIGDALQAALEVQRGLDAWCASQGIDPPLTLKVGVHHGPVIAMNGNERLDYFGRTVNVAARLGEASRGGDVVLTQDVFDEVRALGVLAMDGVHAEAFTAHLRGTPAPLALIRLTPE